MFLNLLTFHDGSGLELQFAKQSGVAIVPVLMEAGYSARGWLGIITAGALWVPLYEDQTFDASIDQLVEQIHHALPHDEEYEDEVGVVGGETVGLFTAQEVKEELDRLRVDLEAANSRPKSVVRRSAGQRKLPGHLCELPAGVPQLPLGIRVSSEMRQLATTLLLPTSRCRVGFCGMGGVGKTTVSSWLVRRDDVRAQFDAIVWMPLGQQPNIEKCQEQLYLQLTGSELAMELDQEERHDMLRSAMNGVKLLLVLDDLWEAEHEGRLQFVDKDAGAKVLISSRVRGLLTGADIVDIGLPSEDEAVEMLLASAGADMAGASAPEEARTVVRLCKLLPLSIGMAGKLVTDLVADGDDWRGILTALQDEFDQGGRTRSIEESVIAASLRGIRGKHRAEILMLFRAMCLIPEDVQAPLEVLAMMYEAEVSSDRDVPGSKRPTLLNLRRWLKTLLDRSLALGTVDRPSLHDIPRSVTQFTESVNLQTLS
eukprot:SAG31_NODE_3127_length_4646_cov_6.057620_2_plen_484_part_00